MNKTAYEVLKMIGESKLQLSRVTIPFLCIHGTGDQIALPAGSQFIFDNAATPASDKRVEFFPDLRHELFHEVKQHADVCIDMVVKYFEDVSKKLQEIINSTAVSVTDINSQLL